MVDPGSIAVRAEELARNRTPHFDPEELKAFVKTYLDRREVFLKAFREQGSPLYVIEKKILLERAEHFRKIMGGKLSDLQVYYAVKSNNHPSIANILVRAGLGLDVSSGQELKLALEAGAARILFSGPGKTEAELKLGVANYKKVTVLMDSFGELNRLEKITAESEREIRAGIRLTTDERGFWRKFGIPLSKLEVLFELAEKCHHVRLAGLQFHTSWNLDPSGQVKFIERLGQELKALPENYREQIEFIDIGGGYWPPQGEWLQAAGTPEGRLADILFPNSKPDMNHYRLSGNPIGVFAERLAAAIEEHIYPSLKCSIYTEPGRWICNDAMHILLQVVDRKADDMVITDGGMNIIGWERYEIDYFPVINLSRPELNEHPCYVLGSLCTPHDVWGYSYFGSDIHPGDILLIPTQGAYTYSLRQKFIKPIPDTVIIEQ
nr:alanine racemase [candidate division Zixibacteria bacterium]